MKTALITTTINVPHVLALYAEHARSFHDEFSSPVRCFVACDLKTPVTDFADPNNFITWLTPEYQKHLNYKCSELIGWNCIQRRNIALLEAVKWGADIIVSIDDDNIPLGPYFDHVHYALGAPFSGPAVSGFDWFDVGQLLQPPAKHRGFPLRKPSLFRVEPIVNAKVGVAAGICLGDPDIDAVTRLEHSAHPIDVHGVSELLRSGIVVDRHTVTVFNSQNTAFVRSLAPAMFMLPGLGRYDDIFASLICQRVMKKQNLHVHFGQPFVWQQRNLHDTLKDLQAEMFGMEHIEEFERVLRLYVSGDSVLARVRNFYQNIGDHLSWFPPATIAAGLAWCDDIEKVMSELPL